MTVKDKKVVADKARQTPSKTSESIFGDHNSIFAPLQSLRQEVDEIFNQFTHRFGNGSKAEFPEFKTPVTNIDETETAYEISAELPGIAKKDIDITVENSTVKIHGERQKTKKSGKAEHHVTESSYGVYERSLSLPFTVDPKKVEAEYDNGILHLTIAKPSQSKSTPKKIEIKSAA